MALTRFDLASRALVRVGGSPITSFEDDSTEAVAVSREYEPLVAARLSEYRWRFAASQVVLNRRVDTPPGRWAHAWQNPADALALHTVLRQGRPVPYDRFGDVILTDEDDGLVAEVTLRVDERLWPGFFSSALVQELAALLALALARDTELSAMLDRDLDRLWARARLADSQQQSTRRFPLSRLIAVRTG